jgi:hypothetical protein
VTLQLDACRQLRPCSIERQQLLALQISACRRPRPCDIEPSSAGLFVLVSFWLDCMVHPAHPASFLRVSIPCSPSKYSRGLPARLHGHWRALHHRLRQGTLPLPPLIPCSAWNHNHQDSIRGAPLQVASSCAVMTPVVRFVTTPCRPLTRRARRTPPVRFVAPRVSHHSRHLRLGITMHRAGSKRGRRRQSSLGLRWAVCCACGRLVRAPHRWIAADGADISRGWRPPLMEVSRSFPTLQ